ncbi:hypothetical protein DM01DRAFT_1379529 [Hesseltinella vesiculosa]|uniref:Uncharacterized protein n=1 Tax=Hesseltinella vesiculosa TaxID=101127 RepID=A0A1X2GXY9_9FUNG|nr:hypothetical protein DM01DRAFT_1379529 [Hesseltinella vesiculosa]
MTIPSSLKLEPCLQRLGTMPEDNPSFVKQVEVIDDVYLLQKILIEKERERVSISNDLEVAARLGLVISETNEALQVKISQLEQENRQLHDTLFLSHSHPHHTPHQTDADQPDADQLVQELAQARQELTRFRSEMDGLSGQLNDMATEMVESRNRVTVYAKRLADLEHKLQTTRETNAQLQSLLQKALSSQKQSSSTTSHMVNNFQSDLARIVTENDRLLTRISELEQQQVETEDRLSVVVTQAKEYASLLESAQTTIQQLSEPRLDEDQETISIPTEDAEVTKGSVFSVEFRQEMQKEIERNLSLRNEIRHRVITADSGPTAERRKPQDGLKSLLAERDHGLLTTSASTSTVTTSSSVSTSTSSSDLLRSNATNNSNSITSPIITSLRPAQFLTGFDNSQPIGLQRASFLKHRFSSSPASIVHHPRYYDQQQQQQHPQALPGDVPSISTRFFQRIASRLEEYERNSIPPTSN